MITVSNSLNTYTQKESIFMYIAECFGVKIYKKYYPGGGSYWNNTHLDKNCISELDDVVDSSNKNIRQHSAMMVQEWCMFVPLNIYEYVSSAGKSVYISTLMLGSGLTLYHLYGIMVHTYNIIKAKNRIRILKEQEQKIVFRPPKEQANDMYIACTVVSPTVKIYELRSYNIPFPSKVIFDNYECASHFKHQFLTESTERVIDLLTDQKAFESYREKVMLNYDC
jgi:hypothetical protein